MERATITIPAPLAVVGERVQVLNYKMRPATWEEGEIRRIEFTPGRECPGSGGGSFTIKDFWSYQVSIERHRTMDSYGRERGGGYTIHVGDDAIRPLKDGREKFDAALAALDRIGEGGEP